MQFPVVKIEVFIPPEFVDQVNQIIGEIGAGRLGNYERCMSVNRVTGYWRPLPGASPYNGSIGQLQSADECKVEFNCPWQLVTEAIRRIKTIHSYEEPLIQVIPLLNHLFGQK